MNSLNTAILYWPPSTPNPPQLPPHEPSSDRSLPFFRAMKRGDIKTCHKDNTPEPHYRSSGHRGHKWQFSPYDCCNTSLGEVLGNSVCKGGKKPSLAEFSPWFHKGSQITHELKSSSRRTPLQGTLSFHPLLFPLEVTAPFSNTNSYFPLGNLLHPTASLLWQPSEVLLRRGESKTEHAFSPPYPAAKEATEEATQTLGCLHLPNTKLEDLRINKSSVIVKLLSMFRYWSLCEM